MDGGKGMDITTVPTLISRFYKKKSLENEKIFAYSLPMKKLIFRKKFCLQPYFHNRLSGFHYDRRSTYYTRPFSVKTKQLWHRLEFAGHLDYLDQNEGG